MSQNLGYVHTYLHFTIQYNREAKKRTNISQSSVCYKLECSRYMDVKGFVFKVE